MFNEDELKLTEINTKGGFCVRSGAAHHLVSTWRNTRKGRDRRERERKQNSGHLPVWQLCAVMLFHTQLNKNVQKVKQGVDKEFNLQAAPNVCLKKESSLEEIRNVQHHHVLFWWEA